MIDPSARVHATADLESDVSIGAGTVVWHRAQIRSGARIGRNGVIGRDVFIDEGVTLGDRVKVQNGALIYSGVTVADGVFVGPGAILTNDRNPRAENDDGDLARGPDWTTSPIQVASGASIGAGAIVVAGCDIGPYAMVGAGAVVTHTVPGYAVVAGNPARRIGWVCVCGTRLTDATGHAAPVERERSLADAELICPRCERRFVHAPETDTLAQRASPATGPGGGS